MADIRTYEYKLYLGVNIEDPKDDRDALIISKDASEVSITDHESESYNISLNGLKFNRKIYEPGLIEAEVSITIKSGSALPPIKEVSKLLLKRLVNLTYQSSDSQSETVIAENYYVYQLLPQFIRNAGKPSLFVKLVIYSLDKLMTLDKYSKAYVGKKLGEDILLPESRTFAFENRLLLRVVKQNLQHLAYTITSEDKKDVVESEMIQPYLIQYNESFYDFMVRTTNRCGELLYFEDGKLNLGVKEPENKQNLQTISDYQSITLANYASNPFNVEPYYRDSVKDTNENNNAMIDVLNFESVDKGNNGYPTDTLPSKFEHVYNAEEPTDEYIFPIESDKWSTLKYEMGFGIKSGDVPKNGVSAVLFSIISNELKNTQTSYAANILNLMSAITKQWTKSLLKSGMEISPVNKESNDKHINSQKINYSKEQISGTRFVGFGNVDSNNWINLKFYKDIRKAQIEQQKKIVCIDMGSAYMPLKIGEKIRVDGLSETYVIIQVQMRSETSWIHNYRQYGLNEDANDVSVGAQSQIIYAIPVVTKGHIEKVYPPISAHTYREAGPQTAYVIDNNDPKYQGRVRILYPWQTQSAMKLLTLNEAKIGQLGADAKVKELQKKRLELCRLKTILTDERDAINDYAKLPDDKAREEWIAQKEQELEQAKKTVKDLTLPKNAEKVLPKEKYEDLILRQPEKEAAEKKCEWLTALLTRIKEDKDSTPAQIVKKIDQEVEAKNQELASNSTALDAAKADLKIQIKVVGDKFKEVTEELIMKASPWVRVATPAATTGGGTYFKPQKGDEVLVNYDSNNVERPYVVGSLFSKNVPTPEQANNISNVSSGLLKKASTYIVSPNGHHIAFSDPGDGEKLIGGAAGGGITKILESYGYTFEGVKDMTGGIHIGDRYGLYELSLSSHDRKIKVSSPFGDINIDAFTGISINAPNGDIKIAGKNVEISAGNNLTIHSGKNIQPPFLTHPDKTGIVGNIAGMIVTDAASSAANFFMGGFGVDLKLTRQLTEVLLRPIEGTLLIKSHRYMKLEAGMGTTAAIPANRYTTTQKRNEVAVNEIEFMSKMVACIKYINNTMDGFIDQYKTKWATLATQKTAYATKMTSLLKDEEAENVPTIVKSVLKKGMDANVDEAWPNNVVTDELFNNKIREGEVNVNGVVLNGQAKVDALVTDGNNLAKGVYELHKHMKKVFEHLFDTPIVEGADQKMKELIKSTFESKRENMFNLWKNQYISGGNVTDDFLRGDMQHISDAFIGASKKFKRAFAAVFITKVAHEPGYQMENLGDGAGNVVSNFIRNPLDSAAKGKFLHVHYEESDVKEDRLDSDFQWHHFLANMRKPQNVVGRRIYDVLVGTINDALQVDEFANIKDRHVWADRGRGTILMSDTIGETRAFDSGAFTPDMKASTGSWDALIKALKGIK